jgi:hypothetical protein
MHRCSSNRKCEHGRGCRAQGARRRATARAAAGQAIGSEAGDAVGIAGAVSVGPKATRRPVVR